MNSSFTKNLLKIKNLLLNNFNIIDNNITKRNRKINFNYGAVEYIFLYKIYIFKFIKFSLIFFKFLIFFHFF
jgi:hypothetical protein